MSKDPIPQLPSRSQANPSFSGSLPGFPETTVDFLEDDDSIPLPDHFPEPYVDPEQEKKESRSSATLETGATLVFPSAKPPVKAKSGKSGSGSAKPEVKKKNDNASSKPVLKRVSNEIKRADDANKSGDGKKSGDGEKSVESSREEEEEEGLKRITDKYAAPGTLLLNGSVSSSGPLSPKDTLPASPTPSITLTPSPSIPSNTLPAMNGGQKSPDSTDASSTHSRLSSGSNSRISTGSASQMSTTGSNSRLSTASNSQSSPTPNLNTLTLSTAAKKSGSAQGLGSLSVSSFSGACSDISDSSSGFLMVRNSLLTSSMRGGSGLLGTSRYQSVSGIPLTASLGDGVSEQDVQQVEMFYRSHKSEVTVCHCLANLYIGSAASKTSVSMPRPMNGTVTPSGYSDLWEFVVTGIPLVVEDSGDHHRSHQVSIVLAEKGTGFVLWKDMVTSVSHYSCPHSNFHTMTLSSDTTKLVGLSFDDSKPAAEFAAHLTKLTADFDDDQDTLKKKGKKKKRGESKRKLKFKPPKKVDISQPCCFQHITKLERPQVTGVMPLPPNSFAPAHNSSSVSSLSEVFQDQLSVSRAHSQSSELSEASTMASDH